jgi:hypothetical protein
MSPWLFRAILAVAVIVLPGLIAQIDHREIGRSGS